jgi:hypothetical protein
MKAKFILVLCGASELLIQPITQSNIFFIYLIIFVIYMILQELYIEWCSTSLKN